MNYILITPIKNEAKVLPKLIESIKSQTIRPVIWIIVDDNSNDSTNRIIKRAEEKEKWIRVIRLDEQHDRGFGNHFAHICKIGFDFAIQHCNKYNIHYDYLAKCDADIFIGNDVIEKLLNKFIENPGIGIAGPIALNSKEISDNFHENAFCDLRKNQLDPTDGLRMYRKACYDEIGGYPITKVSPDLVIAKARIRGWNAKAFNDITIIKLRETGTSVGTWNSSKFKGFRKYYLNYNFLLVILACIYPYIFRKHDYSGLGMFYGYICCLVRREERITDSEIKHYYRNTRLKEIIESYFECIFRCLRK